MNTSASSSATFPATESEATLPDFERRIGQRIWESVEAGKTKEVDVSGLSWTKIAGEVLKVLSLIS